MPRKWSSVIPALIQSATPEKETVGEPVPRTLARSSNEAGSGPIQQSVQLRLLTIATQHVRQHTNLAGTMAERPAAPLVRDEEARAPCVPDGAVARETPRLFAGNTAGTETWLDAGEPSRGET